MKTIKINDLLKEATNLLKLVSDCARKEAKILLSFHLKKDFLWIVTHGDDYVKDAHIYLTLIKRRTEHEPIEYITNKVTFYGKNFYISQKALIPRPETEILIDQLLQQVNKNFNGNIVEVGVGSGIISIILALHLPLASFLALDISDDALEVASKNIKKFDLTNQIRLVKSNLLSSVTSKIDILVSNPPYIKNGLLLERNIHFEPQKALFGGKIGDEILKSIIDIANSRKIALVVCEIGYDQKESLSSYLKNYPNYNVTFYKDLANLYRGFVLKYKDNIDV